MKKQGQSDRLGLASVVEGANSADRSARRETVCRKGVNEAVGSRGKQDGALHVCGSI